MYSSKGTDIARGEAEGEEALQDNYRVVGRLSASRSKLEEIDWNGVELNQQRLARLSIDKGISFTRAA